MKMKTRINALVVWVALTGTGSMLGSTIYVDLNYPPYGPKKNQKIGPIPQ
jgi:hypothetical protein